ncbi:MAG TPA: energy transducer TonB [Bryobacteraceae bacterium]|nr:energy transducer TonB [Bryobacteraceae bacterium]
MEALEVPQKTEDLHLLLAWDTAADQARSRRAGTLSIVTHIVGLVILLAIPADVWRPPARVVRTTTITPLVFPKEPTQKLPNTAKVSKTFTVEGLLPQQRVESPSPRPSTTRPRALQPPPTPVAKPAPPPPMIEPPKIDPTYAKDSGPKLPPTLSPGPAPPQIQQEEKPRLAFETPGGSSGSGQGGQPREAIPSTSVSDAMRAVAHGNGGGIVVGDDGVGTGGLGPGIKQSPSAGRLQTPMQLLSDSMGADFRPYMLQILQTVRRNWFAVMPESARLGRRGTVALQFAVAKDGTVTKIVFATNSGVDSLDRAAVASISMANPMPPLPVEFRGSVIRLQLTFAYNNAR